MPHAGGVPARGRSLPAAGARLGVRRSQAAGPQRHPWIRRSPLPRIPGHRAEACSSAPAPHELYCAALCCSLSVQFAGAGIFREVRLDGCDPVVHLPLLQGWSALTDLGIIFRPRRNSLALFVQSGAASCCEEALLAQPALRTVPQPPRSGRPSSNTAGSAPPPARGDGGCGRGGLRRCLLPR